jgi:hypothetical protein
MFAKCVAFSERWYRLHGTPTPRRERELLTEDAESATQPEESSGSTDSTLAEDALENKLPTSDS